MPCIVAVHLAISEIGSGQFNLLFFLRMRGFRNFWCLCQPLIPFPSRFGTFSTIENARARHNLRRT